MTHGEYEMAFEYLLLEVMDLKLNEKFIGGEVVEIAVCLGLDRDYHYDENFWQRLSSIWGGGFCIRLQSPDEVPWCCRLL